MGTTASYAFDGLYAPAEVASYLLAVLPWDRHPPTARCVARWANRELLPHRAKGRLPVLHFDDLVSCQAVALLHDAGATLAVVARVEQALAAQLGCRRPLADRAFWEEPMRRLRDTFHRLFPSRAPRIAWEWVAPAFQSVALQLEFCGPTGAATLWRPMSGITLRPCVQVGQPCVEGTRIPTRTIWNYVEGGDLREVVAEAFELGILEVERALQWEERLRAAVEPAAAVRPG